MELKATVIQVLPVERGVSKSGKEWQKATVIAQYGDAKYPKRVALDNFKDADKFSQLVVGSEVVFDIDVESREFNGRWYTSVGCWKWSVLGGVEQPIPPAGDAKAGMPSLPGGDDLPF